MPKNDRESDRELVTFKNLHQHFDAVNEALADVGTFIPLSGLGKYLSSFNKQIKISQSWVLDAANNKPLAREKAVKLLSALNAARKKCGLPLLRVNEVIQKQVAPVPKGDTPPSASAPPA